MTHPIKRHANGSIDTAHYISRAHLIRSQSAHAAIAVASNQVARAPGQLARLLARIQARKSLGEPITT